MFFNLPTFHGALSSFLGRVLVHPRGPTQLSLLWRMTRGVLLWDPRFLTRCFSSARSPSQTLVADVLFRAPQDAPGRAEREKWAVELQDYQIYLIYCDLVSPASPSQTLIQIDLMAPARSTGNPKICGGFPALSVEPYPQNSGSLLPSSAQVALFVVFQSSSGVFLARSSRRVHVPLSQLCV